jgi:tRNA-specific adenosine deaminase 3
VGVPSHDPNVLELVDIHVASISPRSCSTIVRALAFAPLLGLRHLKRVRKHPQHPGTIQVLLALVHPEDATEEVDDTSAADEGQGLVAREPAATGAAAANDAAANGAAANGSSAATRVPKEVLDILSGHEYTLSVLQVPRYPAHSREDGCAWSRFWPVSWRAEQARQVQGMLLPPEEVLVMQRHMQRAWALAQASAAQGRVANACVIVDPAIDAVLGEAADETHDHPLRHSVMQAAAAVAAWQRAAGYPPPEAEGNGAAQPSAAAGSKHAAPAAAEPHCCDEHKRPRLGRDGEHPACCCCANGGGGSAAAAENGGAAEGGRAEDSGEAQPRRPYMCTGYDCYVVIEPCAMCAMGLVHSRVRRVIFCVPDPKGGVLGGSGLRLHSKRSLNHHYNVWRLPLAA